MLQVQGSTFLLPLFRTIPRNRRWSEGQTTAERRTLTTPEEGRPPNAGRGALLATRRPPRGRGYGAGEPTGVRARVVEDG